MSAAAQMEKRPVAKSRSLKTLSKAIFDKALCAHKRERRQDVSITSQLSDAWLIYRANPQTISVAMFTEEHKKCVISVKHHLLGRMLMGNKCSYVNKH